MIFKKNEKSKKEKRKKMTSFKVAFNLNAKEGIAQLKERFAHLSKNTPDPVKVTFFMFIFLLSQ